MSIQISNPVHLADLRADFVFGTATAAYQIEGGVTEGGRGPSIWDTFSHTPGKTHRGDNGDIACDHFHRWEADLDLMAELGLRAYRLSLSWARLQPTGTGDLNLEGVQFYRNLMQGCRDRGIEPYVTLYHWDLPQALQDGGGWPERSTAEAFGDYARLCFEQLGDLMGSVITMNEPWCAAFLGHEWGVHAPGVADRTAAARAIHHILLGHGFGLRAAREVAPDLRVGITNILTNVAPLTDAPADIEAARVVDIRYNRVTLEPCYLGAYSDETMEVFAPDGLTDVIQSGDLELISAPADFAGINHYHNNLVTVDKSQPDGIAITHVEPIVTSFGWSNTPDALGRILRRVWSDYTQLPIYITENGATFYDYVDPNGEINDIERIDYLGGYIDAVAGAAADGIDVRGYFAWSFLDNFEWAEGFDKRFGIVFVDYPTQQRIPKKSAYWYRDLIRAHSAQIPEAKS